MTYRQIVFMILDLLRQTSKDSNFEIDHIIKEVNDVRNLLLKQRYSDIRKEISDVNFQEITIYLTDVSSLNKKYIMLKSSKVVPDILNIASTPTKSLDSINFSFISNYRFVYTGYNEWLSSIIYGTVLSDKYFYIKSMNPQVKHMTSIRIMSIFENPIDVYYYNDPDLIANGIDILDMIFPLEGAYIPELQDIVLKRLAPSLGFPKDTINNNNEDNSNIQQKVN